MESHDSHNVPDVPGNASTGGRDIDVLIAEALTAHPDAADRLKRGEERAIGPILSHVMRETKGLADGAMVVKIAGEQLGI